MGTGLPESAEALILFDADMIPYKNNILLLDNPKSKKEKGEKRE